MTTVAQSAALIGGAPVLPDDRVVERLTSGPVPDQRGFALVGDADCSDRINAKARLFDGRAAGGRGRRPKVGRIMFNPARLREMLIELLLRTGDRGHAGIENDGTGRGGPLVDGKNVGHGIPLAVGAVLMLCGEDDRFDRGAKGRGSIGVAVGPLLDLDEIANLANGHRIAIDAEPHNHAVSSGRDIGVVPKHLALVHVGNVHLDHRAVEGVKRIKDRDGGVGIGTGVDDDPGVGCARLVDPVDQLALVIGLLHPDGDIACCGAAQVGHVIQCCMAVYIWLALAKQVQVRAVEDKNSFHCAPLARNIRCGEAEFSPV